MTSPLAQWLERSPVEPDPSAPRRALVLGGGGVLGFAWMVGALAALEDQRGFDARTAEIVVGTSAGSVLAALVACGVPTEAIVRHHQGVPAPDDPPIGYDYERGAGGSLPPRPGVRPASPRLVVGALRHPRRTRPIVALTGLLPSGRGSLEPVHAMIDSISRVAGDGHTWPARPQPWIVATDYRTGHRAVFRAGRPTRARYRGPAQSGDRSPAELADAVVASCSIPAWYPPCVIGGRPYIDGGTVSNASADVLLGVDLEEIYVLAPMASLDVDRPRAPAARIERLVRRSVTRHLIADVERLRASGPRVSVLTPGPVDLAAMGINLMDPRRRTAVLQTARRSVQLLLLGDRAGCA